MREKKNVVAAFSEEQTERLTGITKSQLRYWDQTNFYTPCFTEDNRRVAFSRVYSFKDIVALRVLNVLRNQYSVPLQHLRAVSERLSHLDEEKWIGTKLWVMNRRVVWQEPDTQRPQEVLSKQYVVPLNLEIIVSDTKQDVSNMNIRSKDQIGKIHQVRHINQNSPVIAGTRISVDAIKRFTNANYTTSEILEEYPDLTKQDIEAALSWGNRSAA